MKPVLFWLAAAFVFLCLSGPASNAEEIKNYSGCEVCPGTIWFGPEETRKILGENGFSLVSKIKKMPPKKIFVDLDGVLEPVSGKKAPEGYDLKILHSQKTLYMTYVEDESYIQLVLGNPGGKFDFWHPELYLQSAITEKIKLDDPLEFAWAKMKKSMIWKWAGKEDGGAPADSLSNKRVVYALVILIGEK